MEFSPLLIQDILDNLQLLHTSSNRLSQFDRVLVQTWTQLSQLLAPSNLTFCLQISSTAFPKLIVNVHSKFLPLKRPETPFTYSQVLDFIEHGLNIEKNGSGFNQKSKISQLKAYLQEKNVSDHVPDSIRLGQNHIMSCFLDLVLVTSRSSIIAEQEVTEYFCRCFLYEVALLKNTGTIPENDDVDTEKLVLAIDTYTQHGVDNNRGFREQYNLMESLPIQKLHLECSDPLLSQLYHVFLQLVLHKSAPESYEGVWPYANVMVSFYKENTAIEGFEMIEEIDTNGRILEFLCGSESGPGIISTTLCEYAREVLLIDKNGEIQNESTESSIPESPESPVSQDFTKPEILALVANFETVASTLLEYDPQLDPSLPLAFRNYIFLVYRVFPDLPVLEDFRFIDTVVNTIDAVMDYVSLDEYTEHDTIGAILLCIANIQTTLREIHTLLTLLMRLAISETENTLSFASTYLRRWNRKTLVANQLRLIYDEECVPRIKSRLLKLEFRKWRLKSLTFHQLLSEATRYCEKKQLSHHFNKRWIKAVLRTIELNTQMEHFKLVRFFDIWKSRVNKNREMALNLISHHNSICMVKSFQILLLKCEKVASLELMATELGDLIKSGLNNLLKNRLWTHWKLKLDQPLTNDMEISLSKKLSILNQRSRKFLLQKYWNVLVSHSSNQSALEIFQKTRNRFVKQRFFDILQTKKQLCDLKHFVVQDRNLSLKRSAFECWYDQVRSRVLADKKLRHTLLKKYWNGWRRKETEVAFNEEYATKLTSETFKKWLLRYKSSSVVKRTDSRTMNHAFSSWKNRIRKVLDDEELAEATKNKYLISESLEVWKGRMDTSHETVLVADLNFQRKFFNKIWISHSTIKDQQMKADHLLKNSPNFLDRLDLKVSLKKWQDVYLFRYEREASDALIYFQQEVRNAGTLAVFFKHWRKKHQRLKKHQIVLEKNLLFFNNTNILKSEVLMHWIDVSRANHNAMEQSAGFYRGLLHKKFMLLWYEKYVTKSRYLADIADDLVNKREYNQMLELLRKWNLTFTKNVRRNQQTCEMFIEKWERNNLKSLFELWAFKTHKKKSAEDEYAEANETFGSNTSPLSRKFIGSGASLEYLDGRSYLYTPVKKQIQRPPFTPAKTSTSPTRLQETNQKMKSTKMDALTNRYKLAKGKTKTRDPRLFRSESTVLPPPTSANSPTRLPIRPPPAPRFETYTAQDPAPEATSSPEVSAGSAYGSTSPETEARVLETAKRLQRIKPVVIPQSSPTAEIRYSPISKLRERLQSRTGSIKSPSDVF